MLRGIGRKLHWVAENLIAALMLSMFVVFILQIVFRYLLNFPVGWTVEWVTIAWLWGILFAYAFVLGPNDMIRLDIVHNAAPRWLQRVFDVCVGLVTAGIFIWTLPKVWSYIDFMKVERTAYLLLQFNLVFGVYMAFHISVIVRMLLLVWNGITGRQPSALPTPTLSPAERTS